MEIGITLNNNLVFNKDFSIRKDFSLRREDEIAKYILKNNRLKKCAIFVIFGINYTTNVFASVNDPFSRLDTGGYALVGLIQRLGFWICLLGCLLEILLAVLKEGKGRSALLPITLKWLLTFLSFYIIPEIFVKTKNFFES